MKCRHCGNKVLGDAKYCSLCGNLVTGGKILVNRTHVENPIDENKKNSGRQLYYDNNTKKYSDGVGSKNKSGVGCLVVFLIIFFVPFISIFVGVFSFLGSFANTDTIEVGNEEITSLYSIVGEMDICSFSSNSSDYEGYVSIEYCDSDLEESHIDEYVEYLIDEEEFVLASDYNSVILLKDSEDVGYQLVVTIDYDNNVFEYEKVPYSEYR